MRRALIDLLSYPRWRILTDVEGGSCPYASRYRSQSNICHVCGHRDECAWLNRYSEFINLSRRSEAELLDALKVAMRFMRARSEKHIVRACLCEDCDWLREARRHLLNRPFSAPHWSAEMKADKAR